MVSIRGIFKDKQFISKLNKLMIPIAFQQFMLAAVAAGDAVMLGRLDQNSMSAVSLATQVQFIMNMFLGAVTATGSVLCAQYWGKGDHKTLNDIFCMMFRLVAIIDVVFFAACVFAPSVLMALLTNDPVLSELGCGYLKVAGWSYLLTGFSQCYLTMMKVTEHAKRTAWVSSVTVVINIVLNAVFIFGLFGMEALGARGAALATLIARVIELVWCIISSYQKGYVHLNFKRILYHHKLLIKDFAKISAPILGASLLWGVGFTSYTAIMGHLGQDAAAANSVAAVVRDLLCCLCNGVGAAGGIIVGNELGAGKRELAKDYGIKLAVLGFLIGFLCTILTLAVTPLVVNFMILTEEAKKLLIEMLIVTSVYMIGRCCNTVMINGIFDCGGDTQFDLYSLIVTMWMIAIPMALLGAFVFNWPIMVVYACTCVDEVGKIPWVLIHFKKYKWLQNLTREMN